VPWQYAGKEVWMDQYFGAIKAREPKGAEPKLKEPGRAGTLLGIPHDEKQRTGAKRSSKLLI
jgi:hypothetical protein